MTLLDVNVLVTAYRADDPNHQATRDWLADCWRSGEDIATWDTVLVSAYRVLTNRHFIRDQADEPVRALRFVNEMRAASRVISPGIRYWQIFLHLVANSKITGDVVPDAAIAALAVENRCRIASFDRDFARFKGVDWIRPPI